MGAVSSVPNDPGSSLFLRNAPRFSISALNIHGASSDADITPTTITTGKDNGPTITAKRSLSVNVNQTLKVSTDSDDTLIEYVQDPDPSAFPLVLKVPYAPNVMFSFSLSVDPQTTPLSNLTFISASSVKHLDDFITNEFFHNPNIQNEDNVVLLGDYSSPNHVNFVWHWTPPLTASKSGWKTVLCFAEYDKHNHTLQQLCRFTLWIQSPPPQSPPGTTTRLRIPSIPLMATSPSPPPGMSASSSSTFNNNTTAGPSTASTANSNSNSNSNAVATSPAARLADESPLEVYSPIAQRPEMEKELKVTVPRPADDSVAQPEDGPLFRATITSLEKRTGNLKIKIKKLLKRALLYQERLQAIIEALALFSQSLRDVSDSEVPSFQSIVYHYFDASGHRDLMEFLRASSADLNVHVIEPLRRLYEMEIKSFDLRKREFDDESSQYYSWLSRYLSMKQETKGKKKLESDSKYAEKRKAFELCRFDYYSYMQDLHGGRKQQDVTYHFALFAESQVNRLIAMSDKFKSSIKPQVDTVVGEVKDANKDWTRQRTEREVRRRALERSIISPSDLALSPTNLEKLSLSEAGGPPSFEQLTSVRLGDEYSATSAPQPIPHRPSVKSSFSKSPGSGLRVATQSVENSASSVLSPTDQLVTPASVESHVWDNRSPNHTQDSSEGAPSDDGSKMRKEGLLWAMSRPGGVSDQLTNLKQAGWHKFWVVLAGGKLCEYTNWKQGLDLHNEPINLKVALVREARNAERRFCFEVVTPQYKRVYQAPNEDDMHSWIRAINNAITSSLEESTASSDTSNNNNKLQKVFSRASGSGSSTFYDDEIRNPKVREDHDGDHDGGIQKIGRKISLHKNRAPGPANTTTVSQQGTTQSPNNTASPSQTSNQKDGSLLPTVRQVDPSNQYCADCGGSSNVEWISINLLAIVCIDCSGVHRSLGSHISKVRSLRLDTHSFTPEVLELLKCVSNGCVNKIWEHNLSQKPVINADNRAAFITGKYVERKYLQAVERPNAVLRQAVADRDVQAVLLALASRANPNSTVDSGEIEEPILVYSLRRLPPNATTFPITELLLLNSAQLPNKVSTTLSTGAQSYLRRKIGQAS